MFVTGGVSNLTFDNFEMTGLCEQDLNSATVKDVYVLSSGASNFLASNLYIHGWTHLPFTCTAGSPPSGHCFEIFAFYGGSGSGSITWDSVVVDGSDSDPGGSGIGFSSGTTIAHSVFRYVSQFVGGQCHLLHDSLFEYIYDPSDGEAHGNVYECVSEAGGTNAYYNNILRHIYPSGTPTAVNFWIGPSAGTTDYFFNNLFYDITPTGNYFNIQNAGGGSVYAFNSTLQSGVSGSVMDCEGGSNTTAINMHFITDASSPFYGGTCTTTTNLKQTNGVANSQGYTGSEASAYSPSSASGGTVQKGTIEQSFCTALSTAGLTDAATACQSDTRYACTYNGGTHTVSCPARAVVARPSSAWDVGAYQWTNQSANSPSPPATVTASVN